MVNVENDMLRIYLCDKDVVSREIAGETILVPIRGKLADMEQIFTLNPVGAHIWGQLDGNMNLDQILESVLVHFDASREEAQNDILEFISQITDSGLAAEKS